MSRLFFLFILLIASAGCTMGVGVATTSAQAVYNRHGIQRKVTDQYITMRSYRKIYTDTDRYVKSNISVTTFNSEVLLTGEVSKPEFGKEITQLIQTIPEVSEVHNMLIAAPQPSALVRMSDSWLTTKIKTKLMASLDVDPSQIKVVSENGTVFLMGTVFPEDAQEAVNIASHTMGVQRVVKLFRYIHISKK